MKPAATPHLSEAHDYLDGVIRELQALQSPQKDTLVGVLRYLSDHIRATRSEIGALRTGNNNGQLFSTTADELEEIVTETAVAANRIMDSAETVELIAGKADAVTSIALMEAVTNIYEASAFQDITGQRITKIVRALQSLETKLTSLVSAFGEFGEQDRAEAKEVEDEKSLLNGPQLDKNAYRQVDIDALFESLG